MSRRITMSQAITEALAQEMERDPSVFLIGEDVSGGVGGVGAKDTWGGAFGVSQGLKTRFPEQVIDTPISEHGFVGAAIGAALTGMRPVVDLMFMDFMGMCFDQIVNQAAKFRYMFDGGATTPITIRASYGAGVRSGAQHSQSLHAILAHIPGLKVVMPSNAYEAKGLLIESIRDDDPVLFLEHKAMYGDFGEVPEEPYAIPFGEADFRREGDDITIVGFGRMVEVAEAAADLLETENLSCDVIDPRTLSPLDDDTIYESVGRTGCLVVVDEGGPRCGAAADVAALVAQNAFDALKAPIRMVTAPHAPVAFSPALEDLYAPNVDDVTGAVRQLVGLKRAQA